MGKRRTITLMSASLNNMTSNNNEDQESRPECTSMCLSRELCELRILAQMVHVLMVETTPMTLCWRMCFVKSWLLGITSRHTGQTNLSLPSSPASGRICDSNQIMGKNGLKKGEKTTQKNKTKKTHKKT